MRSLVAYFSASGTTAEKLAPFIRGGEIAGAKVVNGAGSVEELL